MMQLKELTWNQSKSGELLTANMCLLEHALDAAVKHWCQATSLLFQTAM